MPKSCNTGKKYKDKKFIKKFLRCLPTRFMAYKSALNVSQNTKELSFGEVVGMLLAHEIKLENVATELKKTKNLALTSFEKSLLVRRFDRALRKVEQGQGQRRLETMKKQQEGDKHVKKVELQCHECKRYGYFISECPITKRHEMKCFGCKGVRHTHQECVDDQKRIRERYMLAEEDLEEESEDEEALKNL